MTRNLRAFGLALVAMAAFGAFAAQGASAVVEHSFRSSSNSTILTGTTEPSVFDTFTATPGLDVECHGTFRGTASTAISDTITVHPTYSNCTEGETVHTNGCNYIFDSETTEASGSTGEHAAVTVECETGHHIEITKFGCNIAFTPQTVHGVRYDEKTSHGSGSKKAITVTGTVRKITYTATAGSFCGLAGHPAGTYTNGSYDTKVEVTGFEHSNNTVVTGTTTTGTTWHHGTQVDVFISTPT